MPMVRKLGFNGAAAKRPRKGAGAARWPGMPSGFNGAAAKRPRKDTECAPAIGWAGLASMGPRPNGRGKTSTARGMTGTCTLQWGRGQTAAESANLDDVVGYGGRASMGPRPNGRGKE